MKLLYICSSQFSGTTLISFLLNGHSSVATIGHTTGWRYSDDEDFRCSCGEKLCDCPLFKKIQGQFVQNGFPYDPQDFGTEFRISKNSRINQMLVGPLPILKLSLLEHLRDRLVRVIPAYRGLLQRQLDANRLLMKIAMDFLGASVYLDNSHSPYRMRALSQDRMFSVFPVHLIRDPRGVALSIMTNSGLGAAEAVKSWLMHQLNIYRISNEIREPLIVSYESLCRNTNHELSRIHSFVDLEHETFRGDFKDKEHHILGNRMRLTGGTIRLDERWKRDLSSEDLRTIEAHLRTFRKNHSSHPLASIIGSYLSDNKFDR